MRLKLPLRSAPELGHHGLAANGQALALRGRQSRRVIVVIGHVETSMGREREMSRTCKSRLLESAAAWAVWSHFVSVPDVYRISVTMSRYIFAILYLTYPNDLIR